MSNTESKTITWTCQHCRKPIADGKGWITIDKSTVSRRRAAEKEWRSHQTEIYLTDLSNYPDPIRWEVTHETCDSNPDSDWDYWIGIERIRTEADVLSWSAHLFEKNWIQDTRWDLIIRKAIGNHDA